MKNTNLDNTKRQQNYRSKLRKLLKKSYSHITQFVGEKPISKYSQIIEIYSEVRNLNERTVISHKPIILNTTIKRILDSFVLANTIQESSQSIIYIMSNFLSIYAKTSLQTRQYHLNPPLKNIITD